MILYHGTNAVIKQIDLNAGNSRTDFGKGFYMGSNLSRARDWADGKARFSGLPIVMKYKVNNAVLQDPHINPMIFPAASIEWLEFVRENRRVDLNAASTREPRHSYGVVSGPIANDRANIVVADYCKDKITAQEALNKIRTIKNVYQISFHTQEALAYIESTEYQQRLSTGKWSEWNKF